MNLDLNTILFIKKLINKSTGNNGSGVQSNWNQNDDTKSDYVKNRPFYIDAVHEDIYWDGDTTGLEMVETETGTKVYKLSVDVSKLSASDFLGVYWISEGSNANQALLPSNLSADGKSISHISSTKNIAIVFVEEGSELVTQGATFTSGLWVFKVSDDNYCNAIEFKKEYVTIPDWALPSGITPRIIIQYSTDGSATCDAEFVTIGNAIFNGDGNISYYDKGNQICSNMTTYTVSISDDFSDVSMTVFVHGANATSDITESPLQFKFALDLATQTYTVTKIGGTPS